MTYITEWFKIIQDGRVLGAITDQQFARYSEKSGRLLICDVMKGQFALLNDRLYRDDWMCTVPKGANVEYESAEVLSIREREYDILHGKTVAPEPVQQDEEPPAETPEKQPTPADIATVAYVRKLKLNELSAACEKAIEHGFDLVLSDGVSHHFSLSLRDQLNLADLQQALDENGDLIYHADGELFQFYAHEDAIDILIGAKKWKQYNLALYNSLKNWVNNIDNAEEIDAVGYDSEIPEEYCTAVLQTLVEGF